MNILNSMNTIYDNKENNKDECYLLHDILNPYEQIENSHNFLILHGYMNTPSVQ